MKKITSKVLFVALLWLLIIVFGCTNEDSNSPDPIENQTSLEIKSLEVSKIAETTATVSGNLVSVGDNEVSELGVCISTSPFPTVSGFKVNIIVATGNFNCNFKDLYANTKYYIRGYAQSKLGLIYSNEISFTTSKVVLATPKVNTESITSITPTSASINTTYENLNKIMIISAGIYISTNSNPSSVDINKTVLIDENYNTKKYTVNVPKLMPDTKYYVRSVVETIFGIYLGEIISFTTKEAGVPYVQTYGVNALSKNLIEFSGKLLSDGGSEITKYGFCVSNYDPNPTLETNPATISTKIGVPDSFFTNRLEGYFTGGYNYGRVYATNKFGTAYGAVIKFTVN